MNNKKLIRNLIIGVVVIAVLVGLLVWAYKMPAKNNDTQDNNTNYNDITEDISVLKLEKDDVKSVTVENEFGSYTIEYKGDDGYEMKDAGVIPYSSSLMSSNFSAFLSISAQKDVTGDDVGFKETAKATVTMKDGSTKTVILGNEVIGENQYFLQCDNKQYAVLSYVSSAFLSKTDDFRKTSLVTLAPNLKSMEIKKNGESYVSLKAVENEEEAKILDVGVSYILTYPQKMAADEDRITPLFEFLGQEGYTVSVIDFVDNNIGNKQKYNIGKKSFTFNDGTETHTLHFGDKDENGNIYTVLDDEKYIFTMKSDLFDIIDTYTPDVLMNKMAHLILITKIDQVVFEGNGQKYTLDISGKEDNYTYKINGKKIEEDVFKKVYQEIIGITVDKMNDKIVKGGKAEYTVTFRYLDKSKVKYSYVPYDSRNYVLQKDGEGEKILLKKRLPNAMENIKNLLK